MERAPNNQGCLPAVLVHPRFPYDSCSLEAFGCGTLGDCGGGIHVWEPREGGGWAVGDAPYTGHSGSVEDLQWSPGEAGVFASASCDRRIAVWDTRERARPALSVRAHDADVNVLAWNRLASCMLASGADDGTFRIWDLRAFQVSPHEPHPRPAPMGGAHSGHAAC